MTTEDIVNALYEDKRRLLEEQLGSINAALAERQAIHTNGMTSINGETRTLRDLILTMTPDHGEHGDPQRHDRSRLELSWANLTREARDEERNNWRDQQHLRTEERLVQRDLTAARRQEERIKTLR